MCDNENKVLVLMLTTVIIINYLYPMNNYVVKAFESYKKCYKFASEVF